MSKSEEYFINIAKALSLTNIYTRASFTSTKEKVDRDIANAMKQKDILFDIYEDETEFEENLSIEEKNQIKEDKFKEYLKDILIRDNITGKNSLITGLEKVIHSAVHWSEYDLKNKPYFGQLPTNQLNARIVKVPNEEEYVIIFEDQIFILALLLSKIFVQCLPFNERGIVQCSENELFQYIFSDKRAAQRFYELITAYLFKGTVKAAPSYMFKEKQLYALSNNIIHGIELFILGHEYGHLLGGHFKDGKIVAASMISEPVNEIHFNWEQEFEADLIGYKLIKKILRPTIWLDVGVNLFFWCLHFFDKAENLLFSENYEDNNKILITRNNVSHPPPLMRMAKLFSTIKDEDSEPKDKNSIGLKEVADMSMKALWEMIKPKLLELRSEIRKKKTSDNKG